MYYLYFEPFKNQYNNWLPGGFVAAPHCETYTTDALGWAKGFASWQNAENEAKKWPRAKYTILKA